MQAKRILALAVLAMFCFTSAQANVIPGRWDKVDALAVQSPVIVILKPGDRIAGSFKSKTEQSITLEVDSGRELILAKESILKVISGEERRDSNRNGTLIGAGVGFGAGFAALAAVEKSKTASGFELSEDSLGFAILGGLVGSAIGAAVGWAIDNHHSGAEVLYRAR